MTDILIIGGGPAGVTAALYAARAGMAAMLIYKNIGSLEKAERVENFYGQAEPPQGILLAETGLEQARGVGVTVIQDEVVGLSLEPETPNPTEIFTAETASAAYKARAVILATGASRQAPPIPGLSEYEGRGVSYCAVCDAFFYRGKDVIVLGNGAYAQKEARELKPLVKSVTLINPNDAAEIMGEKTVTAVRLKSGEERPAAGVFVAVGTAGGTELAKKLGAAAGRDGITVDSRNQTSVPGLWAAGDCTPGMKQIAKAVYDGALAGTEAVKYLRGDTI